MSTSSHALRSLLLLSLVATTQFGCGVWNDCFADIKTETDAVQLTMSDIDAGDTADTGAASEECPTDPDTVVALLREVVGPEVDSGELLEQSWNESGQENICFYAYSYTTEGGCDMW